MTGERKQKPKITYSDEPSRTIYEIIDWIRATSKDQTEKGTKFERATRYFLKNAKPYCDQFEDVWLWKNSPIGEGVDHGIDLVARDATDGSYWAIQCKCYIDNAKLDKHTVSSFYQALGNKGTYKHTMIASTTENVTSLLDADARLWDTTFLFPSTMASYEMVDWDSFIEGKEIGERKTFDPKPHQELAIADCLKGFENNDRGKLIMACGTGKTLTALRLAERMLEKGSRVLFLAPSIALVSQTLCSWADQARLPLKCAVVCSDQRASDAGVDTWESSLSDIPYPATTDPVKLYEQMKTPLKDGLNVIFSTYQSIQVVSDAQKCGLPPFDLIIADEAHRTTGVQQEGVSKHDITQFIKVHDNEIVSANKRLYMTATPRIYGEKARRHAMEDDYVVSSMDDEAIYGPEFHRLKFGDAVDQNLLTDYKVIVLTVDEDVVSGVYQRAMTEYDEFKIPEAAKIIGCWKGLAGQGQGGAKHPLKNAVAFCSSIAESKRIKGFFKLVVDAYTDYEHELGNETPNLKCRVDHVDGTMNSAERKRLLDWLGNTEGDADEPICHILTNARCLAEGVDVPNLDAVMFLQPKKSEIDITQAVGRVMRKFEGKDYGYIILPVVVPSGMTANEALDANEPFQVVWETVKSLRSHDERLEAKINALPYDKGKKGDKVVSIIDVTGQDKEKEKDKQNQSGIGDEPVSSGERAEQTKMDFSEHELEEAVNAMIVKKCGSKVYWEDWAEDIGKIARRHIERIDELVHADDKAGAYFKIFLQGLRDSLNEGITEDEAIEMLAQHMITLPIFEALFKGSAFAASNPVSISMQAMIELLSEHAINTPQEQRELEDLYASVRRRAEAIHTDAGRQRIIKELYEKFFSKAFKATSEKMGIVYTPNEVVNYILHATDRLLQKEFGQKLSDHNVHILDPFAGTGTFIVNLISDQKLMPTKALPYKYQNELHCNEIILLAYYIATINIEYSYHERMPEEPYTPFDGAVLTDTFQMYEAGDPLDRVTFVENTERIIRQMETPITVIVGNPPYSAGQKNANDNAQNMEYPTLDNKISETYVRRIEDQKTLKRSLYDMYIRAFRWASDRIGNRGIISFVTNGGWLDAQAMDGFRKTLVDEFNDIYVFNLRGNARTQGEQRRKEKDNVFGQGTRTPVVITLLVKNPDSKDHGVIHYHDIGDYLTREEKLTIVAAAANKEPFKWDILTPDRHGDWLNQRDESWYDFAPIGLSKGKQPYGLFSMYSSGVMTTRDSWVYNFDNKKCMSNVKRLIATYNEEREKYQLSGKFVPVEDFVSKDESSIKWNQKLYRYAEENKPLHFDSGFMSLSLYRPFCKQWFYSDPDLSWSLYKQSKLFAHKDNIAFVISGKSTSVSVFISRNIINYDTLPKGDAFPLYWYDEESTGGGFLNTSSSVNRHDAITDEALNVFLKTYPHAFDATSKRAPRSNKDGGIELTKEDIFYYIYGILHSPEYRERFTANLKKELPRIPLAKDFRQFSLAGRKLAELHLDYENVEPWPVKEEGNTVNPGPVEKIRWGKKRDPKTGKRVDDHTVLIYNENLTISEIPESAQRYVVNGRSPLEWVIDRYQVKTDKASGIVNDPNDYSDDPLYIVKLIKSLIRVSMETMEIVDNLPPLDELPQPADWPFAWKSQSS